MRNIMLKEIRLSASPLAFIFIAFGLMFMLPGYPVLCGAFFVTLGLFHSFQNAREANDIVFSALLPIAKKDVVKGKFMFVCMIQISGAFLMIISVILRMTIFVNAEQYTANALMNANLFALGGAFVIFALFNLIFVSGFFKTGYNLGKPFVTYIIVAFLAICIFESLHHFPHLEALNAFGTENFLLQIITFIAGAFVYVMVTLFSFRISCKRFELIDL